MKTKQDIEQHECELQELLQRVMQKPFEPIEKSVRDMNNRLDQVEDSVKDLKEVLDQLNGDAENSEKILRKLKSLAEGTPEDVKTELQPLLENGFRGLNQSHQSTIEQITQHADAALERTSLDVTARMTALAESVAELQATLSMQTEQVSELQRQQGTWPDRFAEQRSTLEQMQAHLEQSAEQRVRHVVDTLIERLERQTGHGLQSLAKLEEDMTVRADQIKQHADATSERTAKDIVLKVSALTDSTAKLQAALAAQEEKMKQLQRQQTAESARLAEQVTLSLKPIKKWLLAAVCLMSSGLIGGAALALHQFY